jgi:hypothetical protein
MSRLRSIPPIYPVGIAVASVLAMYVELAISPFAGFRLLLVMVAVTSAILVASGSLLKDRDRAAFVACLIVLGIVGGGNVLVLPLLAVALSLVLLHELRRATTGRVMPWRIVTRALTGITAILLIAVGIKAVQLDRVQATVGDLLREGPLASEPADTRPAVGTTTTPPDIYVLLVDGYLRPDKHESLLGTDGMPFVAGLEDRGFEVVAKSRSNYLYTHLSVPSMFSMEHMPDLLARDGREHDPRRRIEESATFRLLRDRGYEVVTTAPGWEQLTVRGADRFLDRAQLSDFEHAYLRTTVLGPVLDRVAPDLGPAIVRDRFESMVDMVEAESARGSSRPRLVFAHLPVPHSPFVYGPNGEPRNPPAGLWHYLVDGSGGRAVDREAYLHDYAAQLQYVSGRVLALVDSVLVDPGSDPIIVLVSDHGPRSGYDFGIQDAAALDEASANLIAIRTPGHDGLLADGTTLVNVMGPILDAYFGTHHAPQRDALFVEGGGWFVEVPRPPE